jgi:hypothetical protein
MKRTIFWAITPCSFLKVNRHFGETYLLHLRVGALIATCFEPGFFLGLFFDPKNGGVIFLLNVG